MNICEEIFSKDIIDIIIYNAKDVVAPLPSSIAGLTSLQLSKLGDPLTMMSIREGEDVDIVMESSPSVKVTSARQGRVTVYTHDITATTVFGAEKVSEMVEKTKNTDVHIIYRCVDNTYYMSYSFPESSVIQHEDNHGNGRTSVMKAQVKSLSAFVEVKMPTTDKKER